MTRIPDTWSDYVPYFWFSVALFVVGIVVGVFLHGRVDLLAALDFDPESLPPLTMEAIFLNNARVFALFVAGALTGGLLTALGLLVNGVIVGYIGALAAARIGIGPTLLALAPHGVFELPALFAAAAAGFRIVHLTIARIRGRRETILTPGELLDLGLLLLAGLATLLVAAWVEAVVTPSLLENVPRFLTVAQP